MTEQLTPELALIAAVLAAIGVFFALLLAWLRPLLRRALKHLSEIADVKVSDQQMQVLDSVLVAGINLGNETARKAAKGLLEGGIRKLKGEEKKEIAKQAVLSLAPPALAESLAQEPGKLDMLLEAKLQSMRPWDLPELPPSSDSSTGVEPGGVLTSGYSYPPAPTQRMSIPPPARVPSDPGTVYTEPETIPQTPSSKRGK